MIRCTAVVALVAGVMTTTAAHVSAAPEQVLQSVQVGLGADGTVSSVRSTAVRRTAGEDATSETKFFEPADVAGDLPIRVQTAYRLGDRAGTDLADLAGRSGTAVIEITVQNLTVKPKSISSGDLTQTALVGTPMSIVASAHLGPRGLGEVVTSADGGPITDGVLGQRSDGGTVQWAAVLAPPRLSPTSTFTLVLRGDKLTVPTFDIAVQPRFVADASFVDLLQTAFDPASATSTVALEQETARTITRVNEAIQDAGQALAAVQQQLNSSAGSLGQQTYGQLQSSTTELASRLQGVGDSLTKTNDDLSGDLSHAQQAMVAQLGQAVASMKAVLGDPSRTADPTPVALPASATRSDCVGVHSFAYPSTKAPDLSIYQHVKIAQATLTELVGAGRGCVGRLRTQLMDAIGSMPEDPADCRDNPSAICAIYRAGETLATAFGQIDSYRSDIARAFEPRWLDALDMSVPQFITAFTNDTPNGGDGIEGEIAAFRTNGGDVTTLQRDLSDVSDLLRPLQAALDGVDLDAVYSTIAEVQGAVDAVPAFSSSDATSTALMGAIVDQFCRDAAGPTMPSALQSILDAVADTGSCGDLPSDLTQLTGHLQQAIDSLGTIRATVAAVPAQHTVDGQIKTASHSIGSVLRDIADVHAALSDDAGGLGQALDTLKSDLTTLSGTAATIDGTLGEIRAAKGDGGTIATALDHAFTGLDQARDDTLGAGGQEGSLQAAEEKLAGGGDGSARASVSSRLDALVAVMSDVQDDVDDVNKQTAQSLTASRTSVNTRFGLLTESLGASVQGVISAMDDGLGGSVTDMGEAEKKLTDDLEAVLTGLGSPSGTTGLIGAMRDNANKTNDQVQRMSSATTQAAAVGARSSVGADQQKLEWQQFSSVISAQSTFPAFHLARVSAGSTTLSVFTFHIGKE